MNSSFVKASLLNKVQTFAAEIQETLESVLPFGHFALAVRAHSKGDRLYAGVTPQEELGFAITVENSIKLRLIADYKLILSPMNAFLAVDQSTFKVLLEGVNQPLFTIDYIRDSHRNVPSAHINVHAKRDDTTTALMAAAPRRRGFTTNGFKLANFPSSANCTSL